MPNIPATDPETRALIGQTFTFRPDLPPYDPAADNDPGVLLIGHGMTATILEAFHDWNGVEGLDIYYVHCNETGQRLHMSPGELHGTKEPA